MGRPSNKEIITEMSPDNCSTSTDMDLTLEMRIIESRMSQDKLFRDKLSGKPIRNLT